MEDYLFKSLELKMDAINQITEGVKFLHSKNILHLDLKPDNILVRNGRFLISDFSASCRIKTSRILSDNHRISVPYRPYENLKGSLCYSKNSDLWSLGIIIYEIIGGFLFEEIMMNVNINGLYSLEMSIIVHIEKNFIWGKWPPKIPHSEFLELYPQILPIQNNNYNLPLTYKLNTIININESLIYNDETEELYQKIIKQNPNMKCLECYIFCFIVICSMYGLSHHCITLIHSNNEKLSFYVNSMVSILKTISFDV